MRMRRNSKKAVPSTTIEAIPNEIITEVLARVAADSLIDISNVKMSCKSFSEIAEDKLIYQNVSLDKFAVIPWCPLNKNEQAFLSKCLQCQNPELLYGEAVVDYFNKGKLKSAYIKLKKAVDLGHIGAFYVKCIVLLLNDDPRLKDLGVKLLARMMTKSDSWTRKLRQCRYNLMSILRMMWVNHPNVRRRPMCCNDKVNHVKISWDKEMEKTTCEACIADNELRFICDYLPASD